MKIRTGFVSNSSSSSFCIYGAYFKSNEEDLFKNSDLDVEYSEYNGLCVGLSWYDMKDDETFAQFKERVKEKIFKATGKSVKCDIHKESYYNG